MTKTFFFVSQNKQLSFCVCVCVVTYTTLIPATIVVTFHRYGPFISTGPEIQQQTSTQQFLTSSPMRIILHSEHVAFVKTFPLNDKQFFA